MAKELVVHKCWLQSPPLREENTAPHEETVHAASSSVLRTRNIAAIPSEKATALAPGFRFHPTDEELVSYYLKRKVTNKPVRFNAIAEVDIYKIEPWDLAEMSKLKSRDQEWYFFSALDKKYTNGARMNRATYKGYWKATGKDREVKRESQLIAMKKTLVFHNGRAPGGQRTNWVMHEYRLHEEEYERIASTQLETFVLCRVFHKNNIGPPNGNRYAPFLEAEWNDDEAIVVPGNDADLNLNEQDSRSSTKESHDILPGCKSEHVDDFAPFCELSKKRRISNETRSNSSDHSLSSTATTDLSMTTNSGATALLEFSQRDLSIPPNCMQLFGEMRGEMQKISVDKEALKLQLLSAHAMIEMLRTETEKLRKENEGLRKVLNK